MQVLERKLALLEHAEEARVLASGMAAITAAVMSVAKAGDHVVAVRSIYSNAHRLLHGYLPQFDIQTSFVDCTDLEVVERAIRPNSRLLYLESPGNPAMHVVDLAGAVSLARRYGLVTVIDNTMATPFNQRPVEMGIDMVVHSASKYLSGHSDVVAGVIAGSAERMRKISGLEIRDMGGVVGPFEAWLILRGMRTLGLRMKAHNEAGMQIARWLERRPEVEHVHYPGLASHPQHDLACRQMSGFGGLLSIVVQGGMGGARRFVDALELFGIGVSWGGFESLVLPMDPDATVDPEIARQIGIVPGFVRVSVGLEDVQDLIADLERGLRSI